MFKGFVKRLSHKYGPLPLWAWASIGGAAAALYWRMRKPAAVTGEDTSMAQPAYALGEGDAGDTGAGTAASPATDATAPSAGELYPDNKLGEAAMQLIDQIRGISDDLGAAAEGDTGTGDASAPDTGGETTDEPDTGATAASKGVGWYGKTFTTKGGLAKALAKRGYRGIHDPAKAFRAWAKDHAAAAKKLGGKVPKPGKRPAPHKVPRASGNTRSRQPAKRGGGRAGARPRTAPKAKARPPARPRPAPRRAPVKRKPPPSRRRR